MEAHRIALAIALIPVLFAPLSTEAQQAGSIPRIGVLMHRRNENFEAVIRGLRDVGYVNGQNASIEIRFSEEAERLPHLAHELVAHKLDVILAANPYAIRAVTKATSTIPIVGVDLESDPVASGWAASLARPGGNFTVFLDLPELGGKHIEFLREAVPGLSRIAVLWDFNIGDVQCSTCAALDWRT